MSRCRLISVISLIVLATGFAAADGLFATMDATVSATRLTGLAAGQHLRYGWQNGTTESFVFINHDWYDTTVPPLRYQINGLVDGIGYRQTMLRGYLVFTASLGEIVAGTDEKKLDPRAAVSVARQWSRGRGLNDYSAELLWAPRVHDLFFTAGMRPGVVLHRDASGRLWWYGIGQVWASGVDRLGAENRVESGVGISYRYHDYLTATLEVTAGYAYRGTIDDRAYLNPSFAISGVL